MITMKQYYNNPMQENTYLVTDEATGEAAVIDPGYCPAGLLNSIAPGKLRYILLTHGHGDHIAGHAELISAHPEAETIAHFDEKDLLNDPRKNGSRMLLRRDLTLEPDRYVIEGDLLTLGETEIRFIATPGHTAGGMCILIGDRLFSGDTLFYRSIGRTDLFGGDYDQLVRGIREKLYELPDETEVYPGHGPATTIGLEKKYNPYV